MGVLIGVLVVGAIILLALVALFNSLIFKRNSADNAFACVDVQLKRRFDLVPNLVESVKAYMGHEAQTLTEIAKLRSNAVGAAQKAEVEGKLDGALRNLMVNVENYPQLRASENFQMLQRSLNEIEEQLAAARRAFNAAATDYNIAIQTFPYLIFAAIFGFSKRDLVEASAEERSNPDVGKLFKN